MSRPGVTINVAVPLAGGFPHSTEDDWRAAAAMAGAPGRDRANISDDGIALLPIYPRRTGADPITGSTTGQPWRIIQRVDGADVSSLAAACRQELAGGADGIALVFAESAHPLPGMMPASAAAEVAAALASSLPPGTCVHVDAGAETPAVASRFLDRHAELVLAFDPIAAVAAGRLSPGEAKTAVTALGDVASTFDAQSREGTALFADGRIWNAGGTSEAQELAAVLASLIEQFRLLTDRGISAEHAAGRSRVALAADSDQFMTIAKFRAMKLLLARAMEAAGIARTIPVHAETAWRMMSRREPRMNVLRTTGAAFSAAVGGADSITALPHDALDGANAESRRLARNGLSILAHESEIFRFGDPAAGSGAMEALTDGLAETAWERFRAIEAKGGILAALSAGSFQKEIADTRDARLARVAAGTIEMIGVNAFVAEAAFAPTAGQQRPASRGGVEPLVFKRLAEAAEAAP